MSILQTRGSLAAALVLAMLFGCGPAGQGSSTASGEGLSLVWISLDTVRADHLQLYGYPRDTSPFLTELAHRGLYFEWAISPQNSTLPVHITQFTGTHPFVHGVMHSGRNPGIRLAPSVRTLTEVLASAGFRTRAWTDGGKMHHSYGFSRGFESYRDRRETVRQRLRDVLGAMDDVQEDERFFFFVHTYQAHGPYRSPSEYQERYREPDAPEHREAMNKYDASIRFIDDELRGFVGELETRGILGRTILVITGDHGESFDEYGIDNVGHGGDNLHQNLTRVPWIVVHPSPRYRGPVPKLVGLVDFASTTLALLGIEERLAGEGVDVLAPQAPSDRSYVSTTGSTPECAWSIYAGDHHLLSCTDTEGPERNALYNIKADPREENPLDAPEALALLKEQLAHRRDGLEQERERRQASMQEFRPLKRRVKDQLRALGYIVDSGEEEREEHP